ncbi:MAG: FAD-dependent oxidoreductase [Elusimicrobiota bacterium]
MDKNWDVLIIGGGITGAGIFRDCVLRGLKALLVERGSIGRQTTANSSWLLHGGLRYLGYDTEMTRQSCWDAGRILRMARPLCRRLPFLWPVYKHSAHSMDKIETVLEIYDRLHKTKAGRPHMRMGPANALKLLPGLNPKRLLGALTFDEWLIDPVALTKGLLAYKNTSEWCEHTAVSGFTIDNNQITSIHLRTSSGQQESICARIVVNAAGPWAGRVAALAGLDLPMAPRKGIHLVYPGRITPFAVMAEGLKRGHHLFTIPRQDSTLIGPTDDPVTGDLDTLKHTPEETRYLYDSMRRVLPMLPADFSGVTLGVRPLVFQQTSAALLSRDHELIDHEGRDGIDNLITMTGGKISTFRLMAEETTDLVCQKLDIQAECSTHLKTLQGYPLPDDLLIKPPSSHRHASRFTARKKKWQATLLIVRQYVKHWYLRLTTMTALATTDDFERNYNEQETPPEPVPELIARFGRDRIRYEDEELLPYCRDKWPRALWWDEARLRSNRPVAAVILRSAQDTSDLIALAKEHKLTITARAAGSGVLGAAIGHTPTTLIADMNMLDAISDIETAKIGAKNLPAVRVQAGVLGKDLEAHLNRRGLTLGHFPASLDISTVGGWINTRASGQLSGVFGDISKRVLSLTAVLADGSIRVIDDTTAWIGSEGTLGIVIDALLKVEPLAHSRLFQAFEFNEMHDAIAAIKQIRSSGLRPCVMRLYDGLDRLANGPKNHKPLRRGGLRYRFKFSLFSWLMRRAATVNALTGTSGSRLGLKPLLLLVFEGDDAGQRKLATSSLLRNLYAHDLGRGPASIWWKERYKLDFGHVLEYYRRGCFVDTLDVFAAWDKLFGVYQTVIRALSGHALVIAHISHETDEGACIYFTLAGKARDRRATVDLYDKVWGLAMEACIAAGGQVNDHHGVGSAKLPWLEHAVTYTWLERYRQEKSKLDPEGLLNPGKLIRRA